MAISSLGVGSGLDLNQLVGELIQAERAPRESRMNQREEKLEAQISAFGTLRSGIDQAQQSMSDLSRFRPEQIVEMSNDEVASITTDGTADNGRLSLEVQQLAQSQSLATQAGAFESRDDEVGAGTLNIQVGDGKSFQIEVNEGDTLRDVREAVNAAGAGVTASIVNDGQGSRLVFNATETGANNTISVTVEGDPEPSNEGIGRLASSNLEQTQEARDAIATINGMTVTSSSNTLDDAIEGMEIELRQVTSSPVNVTVSEDRDGLREQMAGFVESYNAIISQIRDLTAYDSEERQASILTGDSTVRNIQSQMSTALMQRADVSGANNTMFAELGITTNSDGTLSFDSDRFRQAVEEDGFENVTQTVRQVAGGMNDVMSSFLGSEGILRMRTDGLQSDLSRIGQDRERLDNRIEQMEQRLVQQFSRMDQTVARLQSSSDFLMGQLANMPLANNNSRR
ncbi:MULTISPECIES: flagellar filament capping protein FliD [unclassified Thioalkalivibrio]|uniref:flagellar filament capping protein FliD n=1 Tax=unclassified Thioalkalivibrio TaxID=2621013 RepID=UPI00036DA419|nr:MULTISPECIES: flagellar filament capping protein FliD [unclassified Thioalkalivibrio]